MADANSNISVLILGIVCVIAIVGLILVQQSRASGFITSRPAEFDAQTGCYYYPTDEMQNDPAAYTCYVNVKGRAVCCLNAYARPL